MKRIIVLFVVVVGLIGAAIAAAPLIAASDLAKRRIATQIEEWTGHPVTFVGEPRVKLFPFVSLTIDDVKIGKDPGPGGKPFVEMDKLNCKLRLLPFLIGRAEVAEFQLVRPHFNLTVDTSGSANWVAKPSSIASGVTAARDSDGDIGGTPRQIAEIKLGRFKVVDGTLVFDNRKDGLREELSKISLNLKWPEIADAVSGTGAFTWRDEIVELNGSIGEPLKLIGGDASPARFAVASKPLRVSFTGTANSLAELQLEGETTVTAPSVRRVIEWLGVPMGQGSILGAGMIEGDLNWIGRSFTFPSAQMELDGNIAEGSASLDLSGERPRIQGTLALKRLDLSAYIESFQARVNADGPWQLAPVRTSLLELADLDVRMSAGEILLSNVRLGKSAAAVAVNSGELSVNIGDAQFYGGSLEADLTIATAGNTLRANARLALDDVPAGAALTDLADLSLVEGVATAEIDLKGYGETWGELAETISGSADLTISDGALVGFELSELAALSGGYSVADSAADTGRVPIEKLAGKLKLADGKISSDNIRAEGDTFSIDLEGQLSLISAGVRAKGVLNAARVGANADKRRNVPFVISGSWIAPLLLPDYERLIRRGAEERRTAPPLDSAANRSRPNG